MRIIRVAQNRLELPPIPEGCARLTHFTNEGSAKSMMSGSDFSYAKRGILSSTSDAFSDLESVIDLIEKGSYANFGRSDFGNHVILIDIPFGERKKHEETSNRLGKVPNGYILGYVNRETMEFFPNGGYDPDSVPIEKTKAFNPFQERRQEAMDYIEKHKNDPKIPEFPINDAPDDDDDDW